MSDIENEKQLDLSELFGMEGAFTDLSDSEEEVEEVGLDGFLNSISRELTALSYLTMFNTMAVKELIQLVTGEAIDENESIVATLMKLRARNGASDESDTV